MDLPGASCSSTRIFIRLVYSHIIIFEKKNLFSYLFDSFALHIYHIYIIYIYICICICYNDTAPPLLSPVQGCPRGPFYFHWSCVVYSAFCENTVWNFFIIQHHQPVIFSTLVMSYHFVERGRRSFEGGWNAIKATLLVFSRNFFAIEKPFRSIYFFFFFFYIILPNVTYLYNGMCMPGS